MSVWDELVGQQRLVTNLRLAVDAAGRALAGEGTSGMTHAWLFTGPPGSGRSTAARSFAAALLCADAGCGVCLSCRTVLTGANADVTVVISEQSVIKVEPMRVLVRQASLAPSGGRWQIFIVEDADRLNDKAADALLKSIEEPPPRTVWLLCAPTAEDVLATIRSRCRTQVLCTPPAAAVAAHLSSREGVPEALATYAARASQGHVGRARALALSEPTRNHRREVLRIPTQLLDLGSCMTCAANLLEAATEEAEPRAAALDAQEVSDLEAAYGGSSRGGRGPGFAAALKELQRNQRQRTKRFVRDAVDRSLLDLASFYRDVLAVQLGAGHSLVNAEQRDEIGNIARNTTGEVSAARLAAIFATRDALEAEVAPALALESLMISLGGGGHDRPT